MWLDKKLPWIRFNPARPAFFVYWNLLRVMSVDAASLKKGDGLDFCHTVMACAFASLAALDKHWKRRVAHLPKPNRLARVYSRPELDQMVIDMESWANGKTVQQECFAYIPSNTIASYLWDRRLVARENESDYFPAARSREPGLPESFSGS
jgi:hypothetical protein